MKLSPEDFSNKFLNGASSLAKSAYTVLRSSCEFMSEELYNHPVVRQQARKLYDQNVMISTKPTLTGERIDVYNRNYIVKRITKRRLQDIPCMLWMQVVDCERKGLISVSLTLPWSNQPNKDELQQSFRERFLLMD